MDDQPVYYTDPGAIADAIIDRVGRTIVLALPLGLGKANHIANALVERAMSDPSLQLRIVTALTLETPTPSTELERRFLGPAIQRLFGDYPALTYAAALRNGSLPANIEVEEFFFSAGRWRSVARAQQRYISANYTDALRFILDRGVNVLAQLVARSTDGQRSRFSLSCNPDITPDLLEARAAGRAKFIFAGQVNGELPFMSSASAVVPESEFDSILESPETDFELYCVPQRPVSLVDHAIGLHTARHIVDGGTLQIGIGSVGDALTHSLILRHRRNPEFRRLVRAVHCGPDTPSPCEGQPFDKGLYGMSEMLVEGFLHLEEAGILKREVDGAVIHAGFFLGSRAFYRTLRDMPESRRGRFCMVPVSFTNTLFGGENERRSARVHARFVNSTMMATMLGAAVSDATEDGTVVSGVGGQFDFVEQAFALEGARAVLTLNSTRMEGAKRVSNIVWSYGHTTIPRHRRDVIITEYGAADLRGKSDADVIAAMLSVTDSQFQAGLLETAKRAGKIGATYQIPPAFRNNTRERIRTALAPARQSGLLPEFPFGSDFTPDEQRLLASFDVLKRARGATSALARLVVRGMRAGALREPDASALARLGLAHPARPSDWIYRWLVRAALLQAAS